MPALADVNQAALPRSAELHPLDAARVAALLLWGSLWMAGILLAVPDGRRAGGAARAAPLARYGRRGGNDRRSRKTLLAAPLAGAFSPHAVCGRSRRA